MVRLDEVDLPEVDEEQGRGEDAGGPARGMDASARPQQPGWGEGRPARRSGRGRRTAHGPAPVPARRGRRPRRDCAAGVVAVGRGAAAGARAPGQPHPSAALALLPATARGERGRDSRMALALWTLAPTPVKAARLRETTLARLLQEHRIRRLDAERALSILRQPAIPVAEGVTEAAVLHLRSLVARLRLANRESHQAERKLDELCATLRESTAGARGAPPDATVLHSLPGVGPVTLATLLTEAAGPISRRDSAALRTLSGVAPVTKRSGKSCIVLMRYAAQVRLRNAVFHWARVAVLNDPKCRSRYAALRARGHSYGRALRGVADRLLGVACVLLQRQVLFDPDHGTRAAP